MPGEGTGDEERPLSTWNFGDVWEAVADELPDAPALTHGTRTLTWRQLDHRADNLARWLLDAGVDRQDKVAIYLYNCSEYLETTFACFKVALVPINTNYRYADDELIYLWENADTVAVVFHGTFAERIEGIRDRVPGVRSWLWVDDGTTACPPWADPYEEAAGVARKRRSARGSGPRGAGVPTISTCSTPGVPPACPRGSCGARTISSPGSTAPGSAATPRTGVPTTSAPSCAEAARV